MSHRRGVTLTGSRKVWNLVRRYNGAGEYAGKAPAVARLLAA